VSVLDAVQVANTMKDAVRRIAAPKWLLVLAQLISRVAHPHPEVQVSQAANTLGCWGWQHLTTQKCDEPHDVVASHGAVNSEPQLPCTGGFWLQARGTELIGKLLDPYPQQVMWALTPVVKSANRQRQVRLCTASARQHPTLLVSPLLLPHALLQLVGSEILIGGKRKHTWLGYVPDVFFLLCCICLAMCQPHLTCSQRAACTAGDHACWHAGLELQASKISITAACAWPVLLQAPVRWLQQAGGSADQGGRLCTKRKAETHRRGEYGMVGLIIQLD